MVGIILVMIMVIILVLMVIMFFFCGDNNWRKGVDDLSDNGDNLGDFGDNDRGDLSNICDKSFFG